MRQLRIALFVLPLSVILALGCGGTSEPVMGPSSFPKGGTGGAAPKIGKNDKTPGTRLSSE